MTERQYSRNAKRSALFGLVCLMGFGIVLFPLPIVFGHLAIREIHANPMLRGRGIAVSALVVGYMLFGLLLAYASWAIRQPSGTP